MKFASIMIFPKGPRDFHPYGVLSLFLSMMHMAGSSQAEIYKWVDSKGQTHYSERQIDSKANTVELRPDSPPSASQPGIPTAEYWRDQEQQFQERRETKRAHERMHGQQSPKPPKSLSGGTAKWEDNDAWRCNLAKDIVSGAVRRPSGRATTQDEIKLAEENVRVFCR